MPEINIVETKNIIRAIRIKYKYDFSNYSLNALRYKIDKIMHDHHARSSYLAPSNYHLMFENSQHFSLSVHDPVNHSRPSIDICMETAAEVFREKAIGLIFSGANSDGAIGLHKIHTFGGLTIVQNPEDCEMSVMPGSCLRLFQPDYIFKSNEIINFISKL